MTVSRLSALAKLRLRLEHQGATLELIAMDNLGRDERRMLARWENFQPLLPSSRFPDAPPERDRAGGGRTPQPRPTRLKGRHELPARIADPTDIRNGDL